MTRMHCIKTFAVIAAVVSMVGCKSKQEAPGSGAAAVPQQGEAIKTISGQGVTGVVAASPKDKADAEAAALRVLAQMEAGQYSAVYNEAAPTFKKIGKEEAFVQKFQQTHKLIGPLSGVRETSFVTLPDQSHVLVYRLENDRFNTDRRLTFVRSDNGKMELFGLNQHDESKPGQK